MVFCRQGRPRRQDRPCRQDRPFRQDRPLTIEVESRGISWNLVESRPVTIEVGFRSGSASCQ
jgi:hypothetical protein